MSTEPVIVLPVTNHKLAWQRLHDHLDKWFYKPDFEAIRIIYSAVASHYLLSTEPIWPIVIAPPSSGKTSIAVSPLMALENAHLIGDITPRTLLSGKRDKKSSLLHRIGSGFMIMKDFGTFLQKRDNDRNEVMSQLREVYDGEFGRQGGDGNTLPWKGKITVIAAATQEIDRAYGFKHDLGERFTNVRFRSAYNREAGRFACRQIDDERAVKDETRRLVRAFFDSRPTILPPKLTDAQQEHIIDLATFVSQLRATVVRDSQGKRDIIELGTPEGISRIHKTYSTLVRFHAQLFGDDANSVGEADMQVLTRVTIDSVRPSRWSFIKSIPFNSDINRGDLQSLSGIPTSSVTWIGDELAALGLVEKFSEAESGYALTTVLRGIIEGAKLRSHFAQ